MWGNLISAVGVPLAESLVREIVHQINGGRSAEEVLALIRKMGEDPPTPIDPREQLRRVLAQLDAEAEEPTGGPSETE